MRPLFPILALFAVGCHHPQMGYTFAFEGPEEDYQAAVDAAASWNGCHIITAHVFEGSAFDDDIRIAYSESMFGEGPTSNVAGRYRSADDTIEYTHNMSVKIILMHEMGHAFGLPHFGNGVMNPAPSAPYVTPADCASLEDR